MTHSETPRLHRKYSQQPHRGLKNESQLEVAIFRQTAANFWQRTLWVLKISILPLYFPRIGVVSRKICIFKRQFSDEQNFLTAQNLGGPCHDALMFNNVHIIKPLLYVPVNDSTWRCDNVINISHVVSDVWYCRQAHENPHNVSVTGACVSRPYRHCREPPTCGRQTWHHHTTPTTTMHSETETTGKTTQKITPQGFFLNFIKRRPIFKTRSHSTAQWTHDPQQRQTCAQIS